MASFTSDLRCVECRCAGWLPCPSCTFPVLHLYTHTIRPAAVVMQLRAPVVTAPAELPVDSPARNKVVYIGRTAGRIRCVANEQAVLAAVRNALAPPFELQVTTDPKALQEIRGLGEAAVLMGPHGVCFLCVPLLLLVLVPLFTPASRLHRGRWATWRSCHRVLVSWNSSDLRCVGGGARVSSAPSHRYARVCLAASARSKGRRP